MILVGLAPAAQVVALQGLSTYAALASAYFFARPVLRGQALQASRELLADLMSPDQNVSALVREANVVLARRAQRQLPLTRRDNRKGFGCLVLSFVLFTGAITLQAETDPNLRTALASVGPFVEFKGLPSVLPAQQKHYGFCSLDILSRSVA